MCYIWNPTQSPLSTAAGLSVYWTQRLRFTGQSKTRSTYKESTYNAKVEERHWHSSDGLMRLITD